MRVCTDCGGEDAGDGGKKKGQKIVEEGAALQVLITSASKSWGRRRMMCEVVSGGEAFLGFRTASENNAALAQRKTIT